MSDIGNALNQGATFARGLAADERKDAAYNALANTYGVALAGDPVTAEKAQAYVQREKTNPIAVDQAQADLTGKNLSNTGQQQSNDFNALANPKMLTGLDLKNDETAARTEQATAQTTRTNALLPGEVAQQGATLEGTKAQTGLTNTQTAQGRFNLNTAEAARDRTSAMGILASLSDVASNGGDVGATFDKVAPLIAKFEGSDPAHMGPLREALVRDPVGTINRLSEGIQAANMAAMGAGGKGTAAGSLAMMKFSAGQMSLKDGLNFTAQRTAAVPGLADQMAALVPQLSTVAAVRKAKQEIPGTPEYRFEQLVEQLKPNLSLDDIRTLKASGTSLGRVTNQEMSMAGNAIANMDLGQDKPTLAANLRRIKGTYALVNKDIQANIARIGTGAPGIPRATIANGPQGATASASNPKTGQKIFRLNGVWVDANGKAVQQDKPQFQSSAVYTDANGNKAMTPDGGKTWNPVK